MLKLTCLTRDFEGEPLPFFTYKGQLATVLKQLGKRLCYAREGDRLVTNVMDDWSAEFQERKHWVRLDGEDLLAFKAVYGLHTPGVCARTSHLIVLLEPGIHLVLLKTSKPVGVRLRNFLATDVMPMLLRTGEYAPRPRVERPAPAEEPQRTTQLALIVLPPPPAPSLTVQLMASRELRLAAQHDLRTRKFESQTLRETARTMRGAAQIDESTHLAFEVAATEIALGEELPELRPVVRERWYTPTQMAKMARVTVQAVGLAITGLGLRGAPGLSRQVLTKAKGQDRMVTTWVYNDVALARVLRVFSGDQPTTGA